MEFQTIAECLNKGELPLIVKSESKVQTSKEGLTAQTIAECLNEGELPLIVKSENEIENTKIKVFTTRIPSNGNIVGYETTQVRFVSSNPYKRNELVLVKKKTPPKN